MTVCQKDEIRDMRGWLRTFARERGWRRTFDASLSDSQWTRQPRETEASLADAEGRGAGQQVERPRELLKFSRRPEVGDVACSLVRGDAPS